MKKPVLNLYSDISYRSPHPTFGWCYLVTNEQDEIVFGPRKGTALATPELLKEWLEVYAIKKGIRAMRDAPVEIWTDSPHAYPGARQVDKRDPWHLVCHYAAQVEVLRKIAFKTEETRAADPLEQHLRRHSSIGRVPDL